VLDHRLPLRAWAGHATAIMVGTGVAGLALASDPGLHRHLETGAQRSTQLIFDKNRHFCGGQARIGSALAALRGPDAKSGFSAPMALQRNAETPVAKRAALRCRATALVPPPPAKFRVQAGSRQRSV